MENEFKLLGKRVRRKNRKNWEYGTLISDSFDGCESEYFIDFDEDDTTEQLVGLPYEILNNDKWVEGTEW